MPDPLAQRLATLLAAPSAEAHTLRVEAATQYVDHLLSQRLRDAVDLDDFIELVVRTLNHANVARSVERHVKPGVERFLEQMASAEERIGDLVSEDGKAALRESVGSPRNLRARWLKGALDPKLVQRFAGPIWVQLLVSFAKRIPVPGLGGGVAPSASGASSRGLAGMIGRSMQQSAERLVDAGRSALGGLGLDLEAKLTAAARDFSDSAVGLWNQALRERLASDEGRATLAQIKLGVLEHILRTPLHALHEDAAELAGADYISLAPELISHGVQTPFVRGCIQRELARYFEIEGERSLGSLLDELSALAEVRAWLIRRAERNFLAFSQQPAFADWLARVLVAAGHADAP